MRFPSLLFAPAFVLGCSAANDGPGTEPDDDVERETRDAAPMRVMDASVVIDSGKKPPASARRDAQASAALDPAIDFVWPSTLPGRGTCKAGTYVGDFTCAYASPNPFMPGDLPIIGPISITLTESKNGEFLEISDGSLNGVALGVLGFETKLLGKLDCSTLHFDATANDGVFGLGDPPLPVGEVEGSLLGELDPEVLEIRGTWMLTENVQGGNCVGPWTATYTP